ncbi:MAG: carboxypeptidase-like regulatory domain-containing protein, partial [Bryobacteraceae bacterium]|nr:carboxypeptidase-like regulatory domain-containing protein [Bryobacteraceae bacterium]
MLRLIPLLFLAASAAAQYTTGRVEGTVQDANSAAISTASVKLTSLDTNQARTFITGADGVYLFPAVPPGRYRLDVSKEGFAGASAELSVSTSFTSTQNFTLAIGTQAQTVTVTDDVPVLDTFEPLRASTRGRLEIERLPNASRNIINIISLAPGVSPT